MENDEKLNLKCGIIIKIVFYRITTVGNQIALLHHHR